MSEALPMLVSGCRRDGLTCDRWVEDYLQWKPNSYVECIRSDRQMSEVKAFDSECEPSVSCEHISESETAFRAVPNTERGYGCGCGCARLFGAVPQLSITVCASPLLPICLRALHCSSLTTGFR